jgi:hypothetical protein
MQAAGDFLDYSEIAGSLCSPSTVYYRHHRRRVARAGRAIWRKYLL